MMKRREFITLLGSAAASWPLAARAQQADGTPRIAVLMGLTNDAEGQARIRALLRGLQALGWAVGHNLRIEYRWAGGDADLMRAYAKELVAMTPDVILASGTPASTALNRETRSIPVVFVQVTDPVGSGFVESFAKPGGNMTGFTNYEDRTISGKWLEILKEMEPSVVQVAVIFNPTMIPMAAYLPALKVAARSAAVELFETPVPDSTEIERAIDAFAQKSNGGLIVLPDATTASHRELIIALAARHRLPAVYPNRFFAVDGGLISYGIDNIDMYRQAAAYVDRILKGSKVAELPVQTPTRYELVINLKTAKTLGLTIPPTLLARADEVIE
jgi:putative tryptophan/tyrosine transport system substrate-binding protein